MFILFLFFFKQKTAYEMRISDWSSDVCSSDLQFRVIVHKPDVCWLRPTIHDETRGGAVDCLIDRVRYLRFLDVVKIAKVCERVVLFSYNLRREVVVIAMEDADHDHILTIPILVCRSLAAPRRFHKSGLCRSEETTSK